MRISDWIRRVLFRSAHGCSLSRTPSTRTEFWEAKFARNRERDERLKRHASTLGWDTLTIWECETRDIAGLTRRLTDFLGPRSEEHTSELQSLMRISYAVFCLKQKTSSTPTLTTVIPAHYTTAL